MEYILDNLNFNVENLKIQDFSQVIYYLAKIITDINLGLNEQEVISQLNKNNRLQNIIEELSYVIEFNDLEQQSLTNISWGICRLYHHLDKKFLDPIVDRILIIALQNYENLTTQNFRIIISSYYHAWKVNPEIHKVIQKKFIELVQNDQFQTDIKDFVHLYQAIFGLNQNSYQNKEQQVYQEEVANPILYNYIEQNINKFTSSMLSYLIFTHHHMQYDNEIPLLVKLNNEFLSKIQNSDLKNQHINVQVLIIIWSNLILQEYNPALFDILFQKDELNQKFHLENLKLNVKQKFQIQQIIYTTKIEKPELYNKYLPDIGNYEQNLKQFLKTHHFLKPQEEIQKRLEQLQQHRAKLQNPDLETQSNFLNLEELLAMTNFNFYPEKLVDIFHIDFVLTDITSDQIAALKYQFTREHREDVEDQFQEINSQKINAHFDTNETLYNPVPKQNSILIDIHGKYHFKSQRKQNCQSLYKQRILEKQGYNYLVIDYMKVYEISKKPNNRLKMICFLDILIEKLYLFELSQSKQQLQQEQE